MCSSWGVTDSRDQEQRCWPTPTSNGFTSGADFCIVYRVQRGANNSMNGFLRPIVAAYLVVAVILVALLVGLPSWAAKSSANKTQVASAAVPAAPKESSSGLHAPAAHPAAAGHEPKHDEARLKRGKEMYDHYCISCHGETGKGDGPGGANLPIKPQDLTVGAVMNPLPHEFLHRVISEGPQSVGLSSLMPPFRPQLSDWQIDEVIEYVRTFAEPAFDPAQVLPIAKKREGPVQKIHGYWEKQQPIPWIRVFRLPEYVQFPHKNHIQAGLVCQTCHGRIEAMEQVHARTGQSIDNDLMNLAAMPVPGPKLTMGWCVECHRTVNEKGLVAMQPTPDAWGAAPRPVGADDKKPRNAPLECVVCHH